MNRNEIIKDLVQKWIKKAEKDLLDSSFKEILEKADILTYYAIEIRYPDAWLEPEVKEAQESFEIAKEAKEFVLSKINFSNEPSKPV